MKKWCSILPGFGIEESKGRWEMEEDKPDEPDAHYYLAYARAFKKNGEIQ